jgi:hypothetical protein
MKGKRRLAKLRRIFQNNGGRFEISKDYKKPTDAGLAQLSARLFGAKN